MSDLIKRLRKAWKYYLTHENKDLELLAEAADLIEQQQQRVAELEFLNRRLEDACAHLDHHNDELAATVERLRDFAKGVKKQLNKNGEYAPLSHIWVDSVIAGKDVEEEMRKAFSPKEQEDE